ncbi:MAG: flagellar export protein FliJ [bacterium]
MARFSFKLEPVVSLKKQKENQHKAALARAKDELTKRQNRLINLCEHKNECEKALVDELLTNTMDISRKIIFYAYLERLADEITQQREQVTEAEKDVEEKRHLLLKSSREKKSLEKLKHRMWERYLKKMRKTEQAVLDEVGGQMRSRNGEGSLIWKKEM